jgi:hypothetical protein
MKQTVLFSALLLSFASCNKESVRGSGDTITETRTVSSFNRIELSGAESLEVIPGNSVRVEVTGYRNLIDDYETSVSGGTLKLRFDRDVINVRNNNLSVRVYTPSLEGVELHGSGEVKVLGNGDLGLRHAEINGSGEMEISQPESSGRALEISGSGKILARNAAARNVRAEINGSGDIETTATNELDATINGSGKVHYWGGARVKTDISGSGEVVGH